MTGIGLVLAAVSLVAWPCSGAARQVDALATSGRLARVRPRGRRPHWRLWWPPAPFAAVCGAPIAMALGILPGVAVGAATAAAASAVERVRSRRVRAARDAALSRAVDLMRAELRAGSRPADAFASAATTAPDHASELQSLRDAVTSGADPCSLPVPSELVPVARAWAVAGAAGVAPGTVLDLVAADRRDLQQLRRAVDSALAGVRASGGLLCLLPLFGLSLGAALGAHPLRMIIETPWARAAASIGALFDVAGAVWLQYLTVRAERW